MENNNEEIKSPEKEAALNFLKSKIINIKSILQFDPNNKLDDIKILICTVFALEYTQATGYDYIFKDISDIEFVRFLRDNITNLKCSEKTVTVIWTEE